MKQFILTLIALVLLPLWAVAQLPQDPDVRKGTLKNGMTYYIRHNAKEAGLADFYIAQRVGSILEEPRQRGLAHFLEHMAFNGTRNFPGKNGKPGLLGIVTDIIGHPVFEGARAHVRVLRQLCHCPEGQQHKCNK